MEPWEYRGHVWVMWCAGPSNALVYGARVGETVDSEQVCWPTKKAYMYVYNGCAAPVNVTLTVRNAAPRVVTGGRCVGT